MISGHSIEFKFIYYLFILISTKYKKQKILHTFFFIFILVLQENWKGKEENMFYFPFYMSWISQTNLNKKMVKG